MRRSNPMFAWSALVAVIVVVAAVAWPAWRNHTTRGHVTDAIKAADAAKLVVMEAATVHGGLDHIRGVDLTAPPSTTLASPYAATVRIADGGRITLATKDIGSASPPVLEFVPEAMQGTDDSSITWHCTVVAGDASVAPPGCEASAAGSWPSVASSVRAPAAGSSR